MYKPVFVNVDVKTFQSYCDEFDYSVLPKHFAGTFERADMVSRQRWLLERFKCLRSHLYLSH